jgi:hypothetical protein
MFERSWRRKRRNRFAQIVLADDGFSFVGAEKTTLRWADISRVIAFKRDRLTTDLLCLAFEALSLPPGVVLEVNEEVSGFADLVDQMIEHLEVVPDWRRRALVPAFARSTTVIFGPRFGD